MPKSTRSYAPGGDERLGIRVITLPYNVAGKYCGGGMGPRALVEAGLPRELSVRGYTVTSVETVEMPPCEEQIYGGWRRVAMANAHLADLTATANAAGDFVLALLADCNGVLGVLGGLARGTRPNQPRRVGLVWIDAHGDYNTPDTSPSGMLGGMPVAVAAGKCLGELRRRSGLELPLQSPDIVMAGLRDLDAEERQAIEADGIVCLSEQDLLLGSQGLLEAMDYLCRREDVIYVHIDLDILDPVLAPAAGLPTSGGISGSQLGAALARLVSYPKVGALAFASYSPERDSDGRTQQEVMAGILGATAGLGGRCR